MMKENTMSANTRTDADADTAQGAVLHSDGHPADTALREWWTSTDLYAILSAILDLLQWAATFSLTDTICRILGRHFDPDGSRLPEWNIDPDEKPFVILPNEGAQQEGEGVAIYDKVLYTNAKEVSKEPWATEVLTQTEIISLFNYNPKLTNTTLAKQVKHYMKAGKTDHEIAVLSKYAEKTVKHFRLALEKANKPNN